MDLVVETQGLTKRYRGGRVAVDGLDLKVPKGSITGLVGPNGAGKTTTLRLLLGLLKPTAGKVMLFGEELRRARLSVLGRTGAVVEGPAFYPYLTGRENLRVLADATGTIAASRIDAVLEEVGLKGRGDDKVSAYSRGMKQRLAIAGALLAKPQLAILDEPFEGLDPRGMDDLRDIVSAEARDNGVTFIVSTHLLSEVERFCDRVVVLEFGKLLAQAPLAELLATDEIVVEVDATPHDRLREAVEAIDFARLDPAHDAAADGRFHIRVPTGREADLNAALVERDLAVAALVPRPRSLATVFRELTGGRSADRLDTLQPAPAGEEVRA